MPFNTNDVVPLGINVLSSGTYTLALAALDGALADTSQEIYVRDLYTGTVHNLRSNPYTFTAASAGSSNDRFEIVYNSNALNTTTNDWQNQGIRVATKENILIKSSQYNIKAVKVCNVLGQTIKEVKDLDTLQTQLTDVPKNNTVLLLNITLQNNKNAVVKIVY